MKKNTQENTTGTIHGVLKDVKLAEGHLQVRHEDGGNPRYIEVRSCHPSQDEDRQKPVRYIEVASCQEAFTEDTETESDDDTPREETDGVQGPVNNRPTEETRDTGKPEYREVETHTQKYWWIDRETENFDVMDQLVRYNGRWKPVDHDHIVGHPRDCEGVSRRWVKEVVRPTYTMPTLKLFDDTQKYVDFVLEKMPDVVIEPLWRIEADNANVSDNHYDNGQDTANVDVDDPDVVNEMFHENDGADYIAHSLMVYKQKKERGGMMNEIGCLVAKCEKSLLEVTELVTEDGTVTEDIHFYVGMNKAPYGHGTRKRLRHVRKDGPRTLKAYARRTIENIDVDNKMEPVDKSSEGNACNATITTYAERNDGEPADIETDKSAVTASTDGTTDQTTHKPQLGKAEKKSARRWLRLLTTPIRFLRRKFQKSRLQRS